ncbi:MAG: hypothetical protein L6R39_002931 [Caloplaca ligustica]|nr:MAG: hypothetical protein L6R39_002931 [Caloplaca ligustica]
MDTLRQSLVPRRISQLYADTKRTYEHMIQHNVTNISQTATHTKLRIQKDRLIAWGLEWADSNAAQDGDIDDSLDRAGISDLVASIMSSIRDLLERADSIQPQRTISFPGAFPHDKPILTNRQNPQWTAQDLERLNDIVKDLTASIDTLCDLSRSRQALSQVQLVQHSAPTLDIPAKQSALKEHGITQDHTDLFHATRLDESLLQIPDDDIVPAPSSSPPSYESVAAGSEDRVLAFSNSFAHGEKTGKAPAPLLLEYMPVIDAISTGQPRPSPPRYEDLMKAQPSATAGLGPTYLGTLKLRGWVKDTDRSRIALVYEIPLPNIDPAGGNLKPKISTLLSFLHHAADTDSTNMPSLEDRFRLAFNLTSSLLHLHAKKVYHRNVNSRNVVFFVYDSLEEHSSTKSWTKGIIRRPFLTSFDQSSEDHGDVEESFISNIYRHPQYERGQRSRFRSVYDYYSLGVILLEIGLWMPISKLWKTRYTRSQFKNRLQTIYTKKLSGKCGTSYMKAVEFCLTSGDRDPTIGDVHQLQSSGVDSSTGSQNSLYWKAFKVLERCCMIDHADEASTPDYESVQGPAETQRRRADGQAPGQPNEQRLAVEGTSEKPQLHPPVQASSTQTEETPQPAEKRKCRCKVWSHEIPAAFASHWQQSLEPKLDRIFKKIIDRWESYSIELLMAGETAEVARPTIYMVCASVEKARKVLQYVNQDRGLFDIKVSRGQILRSKAGKRKKRGKGKGGPSRAAVAAESGSRGRQRLNHYQERPSCGASIGAYLDEQHLPPVSFGGTVLVDGEPYGMSVHHMLENDDIDYGLDDASTLQRSMAPRGGGGMDRCQDENDTGKHWTIESPPEALYPFEISDDEDEGYRSQEEEDDLSDFDPSYWDIPDVPDLSEVDMGDTPGVKPGQGEALLVTQPAIDDVDEGFFPNEEDVDEDHLASHTFGHIHASSGIRRTGRGTISHEVDWALIKIREHRRGDSNIIKGGSRHCPTESPQVIVKATQLGGLKVHSFGRTSGLQTGTILPSMVIVKMPGRISHSQSWQVAGKFGMGGDSGAWVIDNATGGVCAHVLAWSERNNTAYVAPMEVLFEDMAQTLGADVTLPGEQACLVPKEGLFASGRLTEAAASLTITDGQLSRSQAKPTGITMTSHPGVNRGIDVPAVGTDAPCRRKADAASPDRHGEAQLRRRLTTRESTCSPPVATSPPIQRDAMNQIHNAPQQRIQDVGAGYHSGSKACMLERKRKSGSELLIEKGEDGFKTNYRMSIG